MQLLRTIAETRAARGQYKDLALVPTMGALHAGHLALVKTAKEHASHVAVSIFVNPTQFGPREDFNKYPRPIEADLAKCEQAGVDFVFNPSTQEMYPHFTAMASQPSAITPPDVVLDLPALTTLLEGKHRPLHFKGVCQVVAKLFNVVQPTVAVFGQKDYQQFRVISAMVDELNWPIKIVATQTMRDPDGLALSSRNQYLSAEDRTRGLSISRALGSARKEFRAGVRQTNRLITTMQHILLEQHLSIDYIAAVDPQTLKPIEVIEGPTLLAIAARVGTTRLIDNLILNT